MKKQLILAFICIGTLSACSSSSVTTTEDAETKETVSSQQSSTSSSVSSSKQESSDASGEKEKYNKFQYRAVFSDYQSIIDFSKSADKSDIEKMIDLSHQLQVPIQSWVLESAINNSENLRYAFFDLNKDGKDELFAGSLNYDGSSFVSGFYSLVNGQPTLLGEGFVAGNGGARSAVAFYENGEYISYSWSSGTGEASGALMKLSAGGQVNQVTEKEFQIQDDLATVFGLSEVSLFDIQQLDWKKFETEETTKTSISDSVGTGTSRQMNINEIASGNFASLEGHWETSEGRTMDIDDQGNVSYNDGEYTAIVDLNYAKQEGDILRLSFTNPEAMVSASVPTLLIPKGVRNTYGFVEGNSDQTDISKDRIFSTQSIVTSEEFSRAVFYRVD